MLKVISKRNQKKYQSLSIPILNEFVGISRIGPCGLGGGKLIPNIMDVRKKSVDGLPWLLSHAMKIAK